MKEHGALFSAPMVRAILDGRKTMTRRVLKPQPDAGDWYKKLWQPGDRLWVREKFSGPWSDGILPPRLWSKTAPIWYWADGQPTEGEWTKLKPSIHMPRWASRITLEVEAVLVERLQEISEEDAEAEGAPSCVMDEDCKFYENNEIGDYRTGFVGLWNSIHGPGAWDANPWVSVTTFRRVTP